MSYVEHERVTLFLELHEVHIGQEDFVWSSWWSADKETQQRGILLSEGCLYLHTTCQLTEPHKNKYTYIGETFNI